MVESLYHLTAYFLIYSFLGWVMEVVFHAVVVGKIINRGFLNGPVCPIYGVGMIGVLTLFTPLSDYPVLLYGGSILFATFVELVGGYILLRLFHLRWWDYSDEPFNLGGYICLRFSIAWGICIIFALKIVHPLIRLNVNILDRLPGHILVAVLYVIFAADLIITVLSILNLNKDLKRLNALGAEMRRSSDTLTDKIGTAAISMEVRVQESRVQAALARAETLDKLEELRDRADQMRERTGAVTDQIRDKADAFGAALLKHPRLQRFFGYERLRRAFPRLHHETYQAELKSVLETLRTRTNTISSLIGRKDDKKEKENS